MTKQELKDLIDAEVNTNGQRRITGAKLNEILKIIVDNLPMFDSSKAGQLVYINAEGKAESATGTSYTQGIFDNGNIAVTGDLNAGNNIAAGYDISVNRDVNASRNVNAGRNVNGEKVNASETVLSEGTVRADGKGIDLIDQDTEQQVRAYISNGHWAVMSI